MRSAVLSMRTRLVLVLAVTCLALLGLVGAASGGASNDPAAIYRRLADAASRGDSRAQSLKASVDAYLASHRLSIADLKAPEWGAVAATIGPVRVRVEGSPPWSVRVVNDTNLDSAASLDAYRSARHAALDLLAVQDPDRTIRVQIAPRGVQSIAEFVAALPCPCQARSIVVDVTVRGQWVMSSGRQLEGRDLKGSVDAIVEELREQAGASVDQFDNVAAADLQFSVRRLELDLTTTQAAEASRAQKVLLVDTFADLEDAYRDRAASVEVTGGPDAFAAYAQFVLKNAFGPALSPKEAKQ